MLVTEWGFLIFLFIKWVGFLSYALDSGYWGGGVVLREGKCSFSLYKHNRVSAAVGVFAFKHQAWQ